MIAYSWSLKEFLVYCIHNNDSQIPRKKKSPCLIERAIKKQNRKSSQEKSLTLCLESLYYDRIQFNLIELNPNITFRNL